MPDQLRLLHDLDLGPAPAAIPGPRPLGDGAALLPGHALPNVGKVLAALAEVQAASPMRHMVTPGGFRMSVAMTNCGALGWTSDARGYRYDPLDPLAPPDLPPGLRRWPAMPPAFFELAVSAAAAAGFPGFAPDACLVNRYEPGARLTLHQDRNERDLGAPIVSVSLGLPAVFLLGGLTRRDPPAKVPLEHGDVVVWGGPSRLRYHGVLPVKDGSHPRLGRQRINLTFRRAG